MILNQNLSQVRSVSFRLTVSSGHGRLRTRSAARSIPMPMLMKPRSSSVVNWVANEPLQERNKMNTTSILAIYCVSSLTLFEDRSTDGLVSQMDKRLLMVMENNGPSLEIWLTLAGHFF